MTLMITGLALFLGCHLLPTAPGLRRAVVDRVGAQRYQLVFSLLSVLGLLLIVLGYSHSQARDRLFAPVPAAVALAPWAVTGAFVLLAAANMRTHLRRTVGHPMLLGVLLWSLVHLLANGDRTGTVLFGAFAAYAVVDLASAIRRRAVKVFIPEWKYDLMAVAGGIVIALLVMLFHRVLFGVPVAAFGV